MKMLTVVTLFVQITITMATESDITAAVKQLLVHEKVLHLLVLSDNYTIDASEGPLLSTLPCSQADYIDTFVIEQTNKLSEFINIMLNCGGDMNKHIVQNYSSHGDAIISRPFINFVTLDYKGMTELKSVVKDGDSLTTLAMSSTEQQITVWHCRFLCRSKGLSKLAYISSDGEIHYLSEKQRPIFQSVVTDLGGITLKVMYREGPPYVILTNSTKDNIDGVSYRIFKNLAKALNFKYELSTPVDGFYGALANGSWNGIVGHVSRKENDFSFADITQTSNRATVVDFTIPFFIDYMSVAYTVPPAQLNRWYFLKPLQWTVLISTTVAVLLLSFLASRIQQPISIDATFPDSKFVSLAFRLLFKQLTDYKNKLGSCRFLIGSAWFVAIVIVATFEGNLITALVENTVKLPLKSLEDVIPEDYYLATESQTSFYTLFTEKPTGIYKRLLPRLTHFYKGGTELKVMLADVLARKEKIGLIWDKTAMKNFEGMFNCKLYTLEQGFFMAGFAYTMPKKSPMTKHFNKHMQRMLDSGIVEQWTQKFMNKTTCGIIERTGARSVTFTDGVGLFILFAVGCAISITFLFLEMIWHKTKR